MDNNLLNEIYNDLLKTTRKKIDNLIPKEMERMYIPCKQFKNTLDTCGKNIY